MVCLNFESEILDHPPDLSSRLARCREVPINEDRVRRVQREGLEAAQIMLAATGNADFRPWVEETEETEGFQAALRSEGITVLQRRP